MTNDMPGMMIFYDRPQNEPGAKPAFVAIRVDILIGLIDQSMSHIPDPLPAKESEYWEGYSQAFTDMRWFIETNYSLPPANEDKGKLQ